MSKSKKTLNNYRVEASFEKAQDEGNLDVLIQSLSREAKKPRIGDSDGSHRESSS